MNVRTYNEHFSIVVSGSVFLLGVILQVPALQFLIGNDGMALGGLGLFIIIAYAAGHLIAVLGNILENFVTLVFGSPSAFVTFDPPRLLDPQRVAQIEERLRGRLSLKIDRITGMNRESWRTVSEQIYLDVATNNPGRIEATYGSYSINRDLCAACLAIAVTTAVLAIQHWLLAIGLGAIAIIYAHRMRRLDVRFSRELLFRFLALPTRPIEPQKPPARPGEKRA